MQNNHSTSEPFNGLASRTIFCLWTGPEVMSENRLKALWSILKNTGRPVAFITQDTLDYWILPDHPLHPAYPYLSSTHKSDYLRCYLMHYYGGGYTDIKLTTAQWAPFFSQLESSPELALGYTELAHGIPHLQGAQGDEIRAAHKDLIGLCSFIFKRQTILTTAWHDQVNAILDLKLSLLKEYPAQHPLDQIGIILPDGKPSLYPLRWAEILGEILHPLFYLHRDMLIKSPIQPIFREYR